MLIYSCNTFYLTLSGTLLHTQNVVVIKTAKVSKNLHFSEVAEQVTIEPKKKKWNNCKWWQVVSDKKNHREGQEEHLWRGKIEVNLKQEVPNLMWSVCKGPEVEKELSILKELKKELWSWSRKSKKGSFKDKLLVLF